MNKEDNNIDTFKGTPDEIKNLYYSGQHAKKNGYIIAMLKDGREIAYTNITSTDGAGYQWEDKRFIISVLDSQILKIDTKYSRLPNIGSFNYNENFFLPETIKDNFTPATIQELREKSTAPPTDKIKGP